MQNPSPLSVKSAITSIVCVGCGHRVASNELYPFRCPNKGINDEIDHVLQRQLDPEQVRFPVGTEDNPFVRYRSLFHSYHRALSGGMLDEDYISLVHRLDERLEEMDGEHGFRITPMQRQASLSDHFGFSGQGGIWVKDETGNVGGTHKARHLMGIAIYLEVLEETGAIDRELGRQRLLAIAARSNATVSSSIIAHAAGRHLHAYVSHGIPPALKEKLEAHGTTVEVYARSVDSKSDPRRELMQDALDMGALPFTCESGDNGMAVEGGATLAYEMLSDLASSGQSLDRLFIQVGSGGLASACIQAFQESGQLGLSVPLPRIHALQTKDSHPLQRAYDRLVRRIVLRLSRALPNDAACPEDIAGRAEWIRERTWSPLVQEEIRYARSHRSAFMWPWEGFLPSRAEAFLEEETSDWCRIVEGMIFSGGYPVLVDEATLVKTSEFAHGTTGINVSPSGAAGLAGLLEMARVQPLGTDERIGVLFTGVNRTASA